MEGLRTLDQLMQQLKPLLRDTSAETYNRVYDLVWSHCEAIAMEHKMAIEQAEAVNRAVLKGFNP